MSTGRISWMVVAVIVVSAGLAAPSSLHAGWGFAQPWDILEDWGELEQTQDWGLSIFDMSASYGAIALGVDDDCNGAVDSGFFLGEKEEAEKLLSAPPMEEISLLGGVLTKGGWSGVTFINPADYGDLVLLSYGEPPAGLNITAPIVMDISDPSISMDKASPALFKCLGFLLAASQTWATRMEWDFDGDGMLDHVEYWGQNGPVFLGPAIPPLSKADVIIFGRVTDDNSPPRTSTFYVGGCTPSGDTLGPGKVVIPNSNMGFKLNLAAIDGGGDEPGFFSNMGFKLNYTLWQGGESDPPAGSWGGPCHAWVTSAWVLLPEASPILPMVRYAGTGLCTIAAAFDKRTDGCETNVSGGDPLPMEEISLNLSGAGKAALFFAGNGWTCPSMEGPSHTLQGTGPAGVVLLDGEEWSVKLEKKAEERPFAEAGDGEGSSSEEDIVFLTPEIAGTKYIASYSTVNFAEGQEDAAWKWNAETNTWESLLADAAEQMALFIRGEANLDSTKGPDISDGIFILNWLFVGGREPLCKDAADVNDDGNVDISDGVALFAFLFTGGKAPRDPFPNAGLDTTPDSLDCELMR
jgi:hypothetical protein